MSRPSPLRHLLASVLALCCAGDLAAGDQRPDGLMHESVVLRDGRRLNGHYDPVTAILWLDGPYRARLRLRQGDIIRRTPVAEPTFVTVPVTTPASGSLRQLTLRLREQQVAELDRRKQEITENIRLLTSTLGGLESVLVGIDRTLGEHPDAATGAALTSQQQQLRQQIGEIRRRLLLLEEQQGALTRRRDQAAQVLARTRVLTTGTAGETPALPDPMIELRLQALEDEVRMLRADNVDLRRRLDLLQAQPMPSTPPVAEPPPIDQPPAVMPPPEDMPEATATDERVARR